MNKKIIWGVIIAVVVIGVAGAVYNFLLPIRSLNCCHGEQYIVPVTIMVPKDIPSYTKAVNEYVSNGGVNPVTTWEFEKKTISTSTTDIVRTSAELAAKVILSQISPSEEQVSYLKVVDGTAYVLLKMDIDGWAGVSFSIAKIHPIVEKTLLQFPAIKSVKFSYAPGDNKDSITNSNWKTYTNSRLGFEFKYPSDWIIHSNLNADITYPYSDQIVLVKPENNSAYLSKKETSGDAADLTINLCRIDNGDCNTSKYINKTEYSTIVKFQGGVNGYSMKTPSTYAGEYNYGVVVNYNGRTYLISFPAISDGKEIDQINKQILSTFKFIPITNTTAKCPEGQVMYNSKCESASYRGTNPNMSGGLNLEPSITIISPNGGEIVKIGDNTFVKWNANKTLPEGYKFLISIGNGDSYSIDSSATTTNYSYLLNISKYHVTGDILADTVPGQYKVKVSLYDGKVPLYNGKTCTQMVKEGSRLWCNPPDLYGTLITEDQSDGMITITN